MAIKFDLKSIIILSIMACWLGYESVPANASSMSEVKSQYRQETGKDWEEAKTEEKRAFLDILDSRSGPNNTMYETKSNFKILEDMSDRKERTPFHIRKNFENEQGISWEDATEEQQKAFQRDYELLMKKIGREKRDREREIMRKEKEIKNEIRAEKREKMLNENIEKREEQLKLTELRRKRVEERKKLIDAKKKRNPFLKKLQEKMDKRK
jgi:hypothetical protein